MEHQAAAAAIWSSSLFPPRSHWNPTGRMCVVMSPAVIIAINTLGLTEATCNYFLWTEIFSGQLTTMIHRCLHHEDLKSVHASYLSVPTSWCLNTECFCGSFIYLSSFWSKPDKIRVEVEGNWNIPPCHICIFSTYYQHSLIYLLDILSCLQ